MIQRQATRIDDFVIAGKQIVLVERAEQELLIQAEILTPYLTLSTEKLAKVDTDQTDFEAAWATSAEVVALTTGTDQSILNIETTLTTKITDDFSGMNFLSIYQ